MKIRYDWKVPAFGLLIVAILCLFFKSIDWLDTLYKWAGIENDGSRMFCIAATYGLALVIFSGFKREE